MKSTQDLEREFATTRHVGSRARLCMELACRLLYSDPQRAFSYCQEGIQLGKRLKDASTVAQHVSMRGLCHDQCGCYREALSDAFEALAIYEQMQNREGIFRTCLNIGVTFWHMGDLARALNFFTQASKHVSVVESSERGKVYLNMGNIHLSLKNYDQALAFYNKSLNVFRNNKSMPDYAQTLNNIAVVHNRQKEYNKAYTRFCEALELHKAADHRAGMSLTLNNIANLLFEQEQFEEGTVYLRQSLAIAEEINDRRRIAGIYLSLGEVAMRQSQYDQCLRFLTHALEVAEEIGDKARQFEIHRQMSNAYEYKGEYRAALHHHRCFQSLEQQVFHEEVNGKNNALLLRCDIEKAEREKEIFRLRNIELAGALSKVELLNHRLTEMNTELQEADKEKDELLAVVSHDLKNPLGSIMMIAAILQNDVERLSTEQIRRFAGDIQGTAGWMFSLLTVLLDDNAIETGKRSLHIEACSVGELFSMLTREYGMRAQAKDIILHSDGRKDVLVAADYRALYQVLDNLLSNAIKYSPRGRSVWLKVEHSGADEQTGDKSDVVLIEVRDEGPGLTEEDQRHLFKKFTRLSAQPTGGEHCTGLGLAIVKKLVEAMNGRVWCDSEAGHGAAFLVELPAADRLMQVVSGSVAGADTGQPLTVGVGA